MIIVKIFSALIFFAILFTCLPAAYADVSLPPRPRNVQSGFITADTDGDKQLILKFDFPYECNYKYQFINVWEESEKILHRDKVHSGSGKCKQGDSVKEVVSLKGQTLGRRNQFLLKIQMTNIKEETRFGKKIRRDQKEVIKTLFVSVHWGKIYDLRVYDGDRTRQ